MSERPPLSKTLSSDVFKNYYYLKEELIIFCRNNRLQTSGSKIELTERVAHYLDTGEKLVNQKQSIKKNSPDVITNETIIEDHFVCSEKHRAFFKQAVGKSFSFNVQFQNWLKNNHGKTYQDAILAYAQILEEKKKQPASIDRQFEYNTYIRAFFADNKGLRLEDAIRCWKYKKGLPGHNAYEQSDLEILNKQNKTA